MAICEVCGKNFSTKSNARTCSPECYMLVEANVASEGAGMYVPNSETFNKSSGVGGWNGPLKLTGFQPVFDPSAMQKGDRVKFVSRALECPQCGATLKNSNHQCPDCDFTRVPKARKVKLQVVKARSEACDECGSTLTRIVNDFGFEGELVCKSCGLVH